MRENGVEPHMTFMVGNPNEDINDVLDTVSFLMKNDAVVDPFICTPYPGTKIFFDNEDFVLSQYDKRLELVTKGEMKIPDPVLKKIREEALEKYLLSLNNATDYSCTVSKKFDFADLIAIKYFMRNQDVNKLLELAEIRGWVLNKKWEELSPITKAKKELEAEAEFIRN